MSDLPLDDREELVEPESTEDRVCHIYCCPKCGLSQTIYLPDKIDLPPICNCDEIITCLVSIDGKPKGAR